MENKTEKRNFFAVGFYKCISTICESMIKAFGAVFIYKTSGQFSYVLFYIMIYSAVQILTNISFNKFFSKHPKVALLLRAVPYLFMFSLFFFNMNSLLFMILFSISNGLVNSFEACPFSVVVGKLKHSSNTKIQGLIQAFGYFGAIISTLVSAFILDNFDAKWVALAGIIIYAVWTTIFFFLYKGTKEDKKEHMTVETEQNQQQVKQKFNPFKNYYPWFCEGLVGIVTILDVIFVLNVYISFSSFVSTAVIKVIISTTNFLGSVIMVSLVKKNNWKVFCFLSIVFAAGATIAISFVNVIWVACILAGVFGIATPMHIVPFDSAFYAYGKFEKDKAKLFAQKDTFRKITSIPVAAIFLTIPSIPIVLAVCGGLKLLGLTQVFPASKILDVKKNRQSSTHSNRRVEM